MATRTPFRGYASAYGAHQTQQAMVRRQQVRTVTVDFNGALEPGRTIESVTWEAASPWITFLSDAAVAARAVSVKILFNYAGYGDVKATVTDDAGSQFNYEWIFTVTDSPIYPSETFPSVSGPYSLTATA